MSLCPNRTTGATNWVSSHGLGLSVKSQTAILILARRSLAFWNVIEWSSGRSLLPSSKGIHVVIGIALRYLHIEPLVGLEGIGLIVESLLLVHVVVISHNYFLI
jgi:predicted neutral ceramidase superfamily lipid hydrolase